MPDTSRVSRRVRAESMAVSPFLASLEAEDRERLAAFARMERLRKGTVLFRKGDAPHSLVMVMSGIVKVSAPAADGREITLNLIHAGEILGEIALFDRHPRTADAQTMTDCELLFIDRRDFIPFVVERPQVAIKVIELLCARLRRTSEQVEDVAFRYVDGRLAKTLLRLSQTESDTTQGEVVRITQRELGNMVGMSRESINKQLMAWQRRGILQVMKGGIRVVDGPALAGLASDA
jgi:CRP/FNR family cyclic AMP-dependent transcriptional regulator